MAISCGALSAFIRNHSAEILGRWESSTMMLPGHQTLSRPVLREQFDGLLAAVAAQIESEPPADCGRRSEGPAVAPHVFQRADVQATVTTVTEELLTLRDAVEEAWPTTSAPDAREALLALRKAVDRTLVASLEELGRARTAVTEAVEDSVRGYKPGEEVGRTVRGMLQALLEHIEGIDTMAVLLRDRGERLRVRTAVGLETVAVGLTLAIGEGFDGLIATERKPRELRRAAQHQLIVNPVLSESGIETLYGVPLTAGGELHGVAHMGSLSASDFSEQTKGLFRTVAERVARLMYVSALLERLALERARYEAVVDNAPTIIFSKDTEGRYLSVNHRAVAELGLGVDAFLGHTDFDVFPREIANDIRETDRRVMETRMALQIDNHVTRRGEPRTYLVVKFPIVDTGGTLTGIGGVATDITDRRRAQAGQELLAEVGGLLVSAHAGEETLIRLASHLVRSFCDCCMIELIDESGAHSRTIVDHRDSDQVQVARALADVPVNRSLPYLADTALQLREPVCIPSVPARYLDSLAQGEQYRELLHRLAPTSMIQIPLVAHEHLLGACVFMKTDGRPGYDDIDLNIAKELGWRTSVEIERARLHETAARAIRSRDEVLGVVAHDLRSPLGAVLLAAHNLRRRLAPDAPDAEKQRQWIDSISRSAQHMEKLASDLLDQYAIEHGKIAVSARQWPAEALAAEAIGTLRDSIEQAGLSLQIAVAPDLPLVCADPGRVLQVFTNLIGNAVKFTPAGGHIRIGAHAAHGAVEFFVSDTGPGLEPEVARHLFDRHWQAHPADPRGVGLGLAISRGIVQAHGGRIWAASEPGHGTTIAFTLPEVREGHAAIR